MPTTSYPSDCNSAAVTEESTPPDMATTTLVSCGRPLRSRLLSMVPVIDAIAADQKASRSGSFGAVPGRRGSPDRNGLKTALLYRPYSWEAIALRPCASQPTANLAAGQKRGIQLGVRRFFGSRLRY